MKIVLLIALLAMAVPSAVSAQTKPAPTKLDVAAPYVYHKPKHPYSDTVHCAGINFADFQFLDTVELTIENTTNQTKQFSTNTSNADHNKLLNSARDEYGTNKSFDSLKLKIVLLELNYLKSTRYVNKAFLFSSNLNTRLFEKKHSGAINRNAIYSQQCGDFCDQFIYDLHNYNSVWFPYKDFKKVLMYGHVTLEWLFKGKTMYIDPDPGQPGAIFTLAKSANGMANTLDLTNLGMQIIANQRYQYNGIDLCPEVSMQDYLLHLSQTQLTPVLPFEQNIVDSVNDDYILPPHATLTLKAPLNTFVVDTSTPNGKLWFAAMMQAYDRIDVDMTPEAFVDTLTRVTQIAYPYIPAFAYNRIFASILKGHIAFCGASDVRKVVYQSIYNSNVPTLQLQIPASKDTLRFSLPLYVLSGSVENGGLYFADTSFKANSSFSFDGLVWGNSGISPTPKNTEVNYAIGMMLPGAQLQAQVSYNPKLFDLFRGFTFPADKGIEMQVTLHKYKNKGQ